jgi:diphthine-ammonia ligase
VEKVFVSWSGGKDGCLALYRAINSGLDVRYLVNMISEDGQRSCSHGVRSGVIARQAEALGIPIAQRRTTTPTYETVFIELLKELKQQGITTGVFGDIEYDSHREWNENVCAGAGMTAILPLWQEDQTTLLQEFLDAGFTSIVITVKADLLDKDVLGRVVDRDFLAYIAGLNRGITPCGEDGEFHTLVVDGPVFRRRLELLKTDKVPYGEHYYLEILETGLVEK